VRKGQIISKCENDSSKFELVTNIYLSAYNVRGDQTERRVNNERVAGKKGKQTKF